MNDELSLSFGSTMGRKQSRKKKFTLESRRDRPDHLQALIRYRKQSVRTLDIQYGEEYDGVSSDADFSCYEELITSKMLEMQSYFEKAKAIFSTPHHQTRRTQVEIRLYGVSYSAPVKVSSTKIRTVYNQFSMYRLFKYFKLWLNEKKSPPNVILKDINLVLKPGRMYLVLGPPESGKTTLLRAIAGQLHENNDGTGLNGAIEYNGLSMKNSAGIIFSNAIAFIEELDNHYPRLTVKETFDFAFQCKSGGTHKDSFRPDFHTHDFLVEKLDEEKFRVNMIMDALGLGHVGDTFVGNSDVRGVSGGQRRRVTLGEMMMWVSPVLCADEISTGLDSATTYDIIETLMYMMRIFRKTQVISLLQPSPETYSLFDEVILLSEGHVIYAGPVDRAVEYFDSLGYKIPTHMDVADFLQSISTPDGSQYFHSNEQLSTAPSSQELAKLFSTSKLGNKIKDKLQDPLKCNWQFGMDSSRDIESASAMKVPLLDIPHDDSTSYSGDESSVISKEGRKLLKRRYRNSFLRSTKLILKRHFTIWRRDTRFLFANAIKNIAMGLSVGSVFFQTDDLDSICGVLFQAMLFIMLGAMTAAPQQLSDRTIFNKHKKANFYDAFSFVIGRALALVPQCILDSLMFGSILYWMVGLASTVGNFLIFIAILVVFNVTMSQMLGIFASLVRRRAALQALSASVLLIFVLFCGFIVTPDVIPHYYKWIYWWNPLAWAYRGLLVNEYRSSRYDDVIDKSGTTEGENILKVKGFTLDGKAFDKEWVALTFVYLVPYILVCILINGIYLNYAPTKKWKIGAQQVNRATENDSADDVETEVHDFPFTPVDLTFEDISYEVRAHSGYGKFKILKNASGVFSAGRMCALMGSSGAGKTTLMDVIALRKTSGIVTGEVRLNGFLQEAKSFRRCTGYVEQFDVQSSELTVRETVMFSANLRLDSNNPIVGDSEEMSKFIDMILRMLELTSEQNYLVGNDEEGGLNLSQRKRLSIAVELAASPSIIFLDEPTSGLTSRAAMLVMKSLRRICDTGRTICATIHQPSSTVFEMFDDLLLLKKGGQTVYFGELGNYSCNLIHYFESLGVKPISQGENPATWMLNVISSGTSQFQDTFDFVEAYRASTEYETLTAQLNQMKSIRDERKEIKYETEYATTSMRRNELVSKRLNLIYWRSPAYNLGRLELAVLIAFILASVFITDSNPESFTENEMSSVLSTIFIAFIILGVLSIITVLPVMLSIRDVFYRHRAAGMLGHNSLSLALGVAEKKFVVFMSTLFCAVFYCTMGALDFSIKRFSVFWLFFTFNLAIYSSFGQAFMCLVPSMATAQILGSIFIGLNNFFSGLIVRPQFMNGFWQAPYWVTPGHYVFEGLVAFQFHDDHRDVKANTGTDFYDFLNCTNANATCVGTVSQFVDNFFGGNFTKDHTIINAAALCIFLFVARCLTTFALKRFNYIST